MYIEYATLVNIGPHKRQTLGTPDKPLPRGTIGIFGPNGSGKSTMTEAIVSSLTNRFTGIGDTKADVVCDRWKEKEKAFVEVGFCHQEEHYLLVNSVKPDKVTLQNKTDAEPTKGWENVNNRLELVGLSGEIINAVFLRQNEIDGLFSSSPTVRARLYQKMLMLGNLANTQKTMSDFSRAKRLGVTVYDKKDDLTVAITQLQTQLKEAEDTRDGLLAQCISSVEYTALRDAVALVSKRETIRRELAGLEKRHSESRIVIRNHTKVLKEQAPLWRTDLARTKKNRVKALGYISEFRNFKILLARYKEYQEKREKLAQAERRLEDIEVPDFDEGLLARTRERREVVRNQYKALKDLVDTFGSLEGKPVCPTCKQKIDNVQKAIKANREQMEPLKAEGLKLKAEVEALEKEKTERDDAIERRVRLRTSVDTLKGALAEAVSKPELEDRVEKNKLVQRTRIQIGKRNKTVRILRNSRSEVKTNLPVYRELGKSIALRTADLKQADSVGEDRTEELKRQDTIRDKAAQTKGTVQSLERAIEDHQDSLKENQQRLKEVADSMVRVSIIERTSEVFHPTRLPLRVSRACLKALEPAINQNIRKFGGGFICRPTDTLDLMVTMPDRKERSINRLSIGQKVVLSICFYLAQLQLFAEDIGMLVLDEPTANLDEKNRRYLGEVLKNVSRSLRNKLQMIVISHDPLLKPSFDRVVEIG